MNSFHLLLLIVSILALVTTVFSLDGITHYTFNRFPYKKKPKNERRIKTAKAKCEELEECSNAHGLQQIACVRMCMSQKCYTELYAHDELEEGEIDVRYNSFKGCVLQDLPKN